MKLKDLCGKHILSGVEVGSTEDEYGELAHYMMFTLDGTTYRALEDPDDGFRSFCRELEIVECKCKTKLPDIEVYCEYIDIIGKGVWDEDADVLVVVDAKSQLPILRVGTGNTHDYYPYCVMHWIPENMAINQGERKKANREE